MTAGDVATQPVESPEDEATPAVPVLTAPADGVPPVIADDRALAEAATVLAGGHGPVAVDAERASGYRYGQRAYLIQLRRDGAGTMLIDPVTVTDFAPLQAVLADAEWVLHSASQDLPCLRELGLVPATLFDTELAGRLLGLPRVGLAALTESLLGVALAKEHSAVDWSTRPLPSSWLTYAALDVELLLPLRALLVERLAADGKSTWAEQEFARVAAAPPAPPRVDPWRRTSGIHRLRDRRQLAAVRELWTERDAIARQRDTAGGRILPDSAIVEAATALPEGEAALLALPGFKGRGARRYAPRWAAAIDRARALTQAALPPLAGPSDGPPPPRAWRDRDPVAADRLTRARAAVTALAEASDLPPENLISPDLVRRLCWEPPDPADEPAVSAALIGAGARPWQVALVAPALADALIAPPADGDAPPQ